MGHLGRITTLPLQCLLPVHAWMPQTCSPAPTAAGRTQHTLCMGAASMAGMRTAHASYSPLQAAATPDLAKHRGHRSSAIWRARFAHSYSKKREIRAAAVIGTSTLQQHLMLGRTPAALAPFCRLHSCAAHMHAAASADAARMCLVGLTRRGGTAARSGTSAS